MADRHRRTGRPRHEVCREHGRDEHAQDPRRVHGTATHAHIEEPFELGGARLLPVHVGGDLLRIGVGRRPGSHRQPLGNGDHSRVLGLHLLAPHIVLADPRLKAIVGYVPR